MRPGVPVGGRFVPVLSLLGVENGVFGDGGVGGETAYKNEVLV